MTPDAMCLHLRCARKSNPEIFSYRKLGVKIGRSYEVVRRVEGGRGAFENLRRVADALGFDIRLFDSDGNVLVFAIDAPNLGEQLRRYRRDVLQVTRKSF